MERYLHSSKASAVLVRIGLADANRRIGPSTASRVREALSVVAASPRMANPIELIKREKHGFDVWPDVLRYSRAKTPMKEINREP
jgi:hypothetical protein